jgi:Protein of unknown function (DUF3455)
MHQRRCKELVNVLNLCDFLSESIACLSRELLTYDCQLPETRGPVFGGPWTVLLHTVMRKRRRKEVNNNCSNKFWSGGTARRIIRGGLLTALAVAVSGIASAQDTAPDKKDEIAYGQLPSPATPEAITPPEGNSAFLLGHGVGTQGYVCLPSGSGASWTVNNARPEATLFTNVFGAAFQIITHFLSPVENPNDVGPKPPRFGDVTWQSSFDSSKVWAQKTNFIPAGSNASCPNAGAIDCLLLQTIGSEQGPAGGRALTKTTFIQRLNTNGGSAPATGCSVSTDVGKQALVPYSADYYFFRADQ